MEQENVKGVGKVKKEREGMEKRRREEVEGMLLCTQFQLSDPPVCLPYNSAVRPSVRLSVPFSPGRKGRIETSYKLEKYSPLRK